MRAIVVVVAISTLLILVAVGQTPANDPIADKLEKARAAYRDKVAGVRKPILDKFDEAISKARKKGDVAGVSNLTEDRAEFERKGIPPRRFASTTFKKSSDKVKKEMLSAYDAAMLEYLTDKKDSEIPKVRAEKEDFLLNPSALLNITPAQLPTRPNFQARDDLTGRWFWKRSGDILLPVDFFDDNTLVLNNTDAGKWKVVGDSVELKVADPLAPRGIRFDTMKLSDDRERMDGMTPDGKFIFAIRIANRREMMKWQQNGFSNDPRLVWKSDQYFWKHVEPGFWAAGGPGLDAKPGEKNREVARTEKYIYIFDSSRWTYLIRISSTEASTLSGHDMGWRRDSTKGGWLANK